MFQLFDFLTCDPAFPKLSLKFPHAPNFVVLCLSHIPYFPSLRPIPPFYVPMPLPYVPHTSVFLFSLNVLMAFPICHIPILSFNLTLFNTGTLQDLETSSCWHAKIKWQI